MSVRRCQEEVNSYEFSEWLAFWRNEPMGDDRIDIGLAQIGSAFVNTQIAKGKRTEPKDFMIDWWKEGPEHNEEAKAREVEAGLRAFFAKEKAKQDGKD